ncbi:MAG: ATP-binding protein [Thermoflexales bacterium]|nr:ATP-binding protein [Thermoflexales bacterium]
MKPIRIDPCPSPGHCPGYYWPSNLPAGHPQANQWIPCACTLARQAAAIKVTLPTGIRAMTFGSFQVENGNREAYELASQLADDPWGQAWCWLVLIGANGRGKTHLAAAVVNALLDCGEPAFFEGVPALLDWLRDGYGEQSAEDFASRLARVKQAPVLVLDDLGAESSGRDERVSWAEDKLYQIVNDRLENRLPTVYTTNLPLEPTPGYRCVPPRLASRLRDRSISRVKAIACGDRRIRK